MAVGGENGDERISPENFIDEEAFVQLDIICVGAFASIISTLDSCLFVLSGGIGIPGTIFEILLMKVSVVPNN